MSDEGINEEAAHDILGVMDFDLLNAIRGFVQSTNNKSVQQGRASIVAKAARHLGVDFSRFDNSPEG